MHRVADLAKEAGSSLREGVDIDESKGPVFVHEGAHVGPYVSIEGPAYGKRVPRLGTGHT